MEMHSAITLLFSGVVKLVVLNGVLGEAEFIPSVNRNAKAFTKIANPAVPESFLEGTVNPWRFVRYAMQGLAVHGQGRVRKVSRHPPWIGLMEEVSVESIFQRGKLREAKGVVFLNEKVLVWGGTQEPEKPFKPVNGVFAGMAGRSPTIIAGIMNFQGIIPRAKDNAIIGQ